MATIQNERDKILQATVPRMNPVPLPPEVEEVINATRGVRISAPSTVFQVGTGGVHSPTSITMSAFLTNITGTVNWSVIAGTATLSNTTGLTTTLVGVDMSSTSVTIRARVTVGSTNYDGTWTIAKVADGVNGAAGANGMRGSRSIFATYATLTRYPGRASNKAKWSGGAQTEASAINVDNAARNAIWTAIGGMGTPSSNAHLVLGDTVTMTNSGQTVSVTGYWNGVDWMSPGTVLDGNLLVGGDISGQSFTGGAFNGTTFVGATSMSLLSSDYLTSPIGMYEDPTAPPGLAAIFRMGEGRMFIGGNNTSTAALYVNTISAAGAPASAIVRINSNFRVDRGIELYGSVTGTNSLFSRVSGPSTGAATATFSGTKPGAANTNTWMLTTINGVNYYVPVWAA